jgi:hypothetical protein
LDKLELVFQGENGCTRIDPTGDNEDTEVATPANVRGRDMDSIPSWVQWTATAEFAAETGEAGKR